jgi:hypothetical protein
MKVKVVKERMVLQERAKEGVAGMGMGLAEGTTSCTRVAEIPAMVTKVREAASAFETPWLPVGSRKPPCPIHCSHPPAKTAGLLQGP